jgi:hypothetical protein
MSKFQYHRKEIVLKKNKQKLESVYSEAKWVLFKKLKQNKKTTT